jgi:hypothetical protein
VKPAFLTGPDDFRAWLEENAGTAQDLSVGFHTKATGPPSITWPEAVSEALSFGWIDGVRRSSGTRRGSTRPRSGASEPTSALDVLPGAGAFLPKCSRVVGRERRARGDERAEA